MMVGRGLWMARMGFRPGIASLSDETYGWAIRGGDSPPGSPAMFNRRHFLAGATLAGLAAPAILRAEGGIFREFPFSLGVAAGDPASDGFVIWKIGRAHV